MRYAGRPVAAGSPGGWRACASVNPGIEKKGWRIQSPIKTVVQANEGRYQYKAD